MTEPGPQRPAVAEPSASGVLLPPNFVFGAVQSDLELVGESLRAEVAAPEPPSPTIPDGPLKTFTDLLGDNGITFAGNGFNTIFRPHSSTPPRNPEADVGDNVLELNLTTETQTFQRIPGKVPNRGMEQGDIDLLGMTYLQTVFDVTKPGTPPTGIHVEPGIWMAVPQTSHPTLGQTVVRMASIPHGTTIVAQGDLTPASTAEGPPKFPVIGITPIDNSNGQPVSTFDSLKAATPTDARIPADLGPYIKAGTITAGMLNDPNKFLDNHNQSQNIRSTTTLSISTNPPKPLFGGGADNIAFLLGDAAAARPNAQTTRMDATFWIEIVEYTVVVEPVWPGPLLLHPQETLAPGQPAPTFLVNPPPTITQSRTITVQSVQIQYSQQVFLNFNGLTWPHVSVATLVPRDPIKVPWP